jgi:hypothetical protein
VHAFAAVREAHAPRGRMAALEVVRGRGLGSSAPAWRDEY